MMDGYIGSSWTEIQTRTPRPSRGCFFPKVEVDLKRRIVAFLCSEATKFKLALQQPVKPCLVRFPLNDFVFTFCAPDVIVSGIAASNTRLRNLP